jgi:hypothetical protein
MTGKLQLRCLALRFMYHVRATERVLFADINTTILYIGATEGGGQRGRSLCVPTEIAVYSITSMQRKRGSKQQNWFPVREICHAVAKQHITQLTQSAPKCLTVPRFVLYSDDLTTESRCL